MGVWIALLVAGVVVVGLALRRRFLTSSSTVSEIDVGEVSQSWLNEQRAEKRDD